MFQAKKTHEFQCEYCPKWFSKRSSLRNHLRSHRDQMYLDETGLSREENTSTVSGPLLNTSQEYKLSMGNLNIHLQNEVSLTSTIFTKIINQYKLTYFDTVLHYRLNMILYMEMIIYIVVTITKI